jgi:UDP-N-acetyl-D-galactosamine dehydrogenase
MHEYDINLIGEPQAGQYDAVIVAVGHRQFAEIGSVGIRAFGKPASVLYDVKYVLPRDAVDGRL